MSAYLITGISGFVAGHYLEYLAKNKPGARIFGIDERPSDFSFLEEGYRKGIKLYSFSLMDVPSVEALLEEAKPDYIVHLASYSSVASSWQNPALCFVNNTNIFLNIAESVRKLAAKSRILSVGSSEEYGIVRKEDTPLKEDAKLDPASPYAVARVSQELLSEVYARGYNTHIVRTRSFNHIGPRQRENFAVSGFARQIIEAKRGRRQEITCGDIGITRDFIDVRDVVRAYDLLLEKGESGQVYNVCSGKGYTLSRILEMLQEEAGIGFPVQKDPLLMRPVDNPFIVGSLEKLNKAVSFEPEYGIKDSLRSVLDYWEKAL